MANEEMVSQFIQDNRLQDIKGQHMLFANKNGSNGVQSELEASLQNMIEKLEEEATLLDQKLGVQEKESEKLRGELNHAAEMKKAILADKELVDSKQNALEKYIIELQKKYTDLERGIDEKGDQIAELCDKEWARNLEHLKTEQKLLDRFLLEKQSELQNMQKYISTLFHQGEGAPNALLLEEQSRELALTKRLLIERENRSNECTRKWRDLYDENTRKDAQIKGLNLQLERQAELYQQLYTDYDNQYYKRQNIAAKIVGLQDTDQALEEASEFLVEQMKSIQEETDDLNTDNQELRRNYHELCQEIGKLEGQKGYYESCFDPQNYSNENVFKAVTSMKDRIDELFDLGEDLKVYSTKQEAENLQLLLTFATERFKRLRENTNARLTNRIEIVNKSGVPQDKEENTVGFFAKLLGEKERKIDTLTELLAKETSEIKLTQDEIEELRGKKEGLDSMCQGRISLLRHTG